MRFRQEVLNVALAEILEEIGLVAVPEEIVKRVGQRKMPDVLVEVQGLRLMIEGEIGFEESALARAASSAKSRVEGGLAHIAIAVVYPESLLSAESVESLREKMREEALSFRIFTESRETETLTGNPRDLADALRRTLEWLTSEDVVKSAVAVMQAGLEVFSAAALPKAGIIARLAKVLGISPPESKDKKHEEDYRSTVAYVGGLSLLNAMIFHEVIAASRGDIPSVSQLEGNSMADMVDSLKERWDYILKEIDYYPIFHIAKELLLALSTDHYIYQGLKALAKAAREVVGNRAALRHDLAGRVYHRLLANAKYMGTFYTSIPAATLLLKIALSRKEFPVDWLNLEDIGKLRIADLACGTGTLLMAAADAITDNHIRVSAEAGIPPRVDDLQRVLMEKTLWGFDILPSAVHLTASTLAMRAPEISVNNMNLFSLPLGGDYLGSIDFLRGRAVYPKDLFGALVKANQVNAHGEETVRVSLPDLHLCVMNPPFTRSVGGNLLFGWLPQAERARLQKTLRKVVEEHERANIQAGLGAVFVRVAHRYMNQGSRLALVLPKAVLSGVAWAETRNLISRNYTLDYVVQSFDPAQWNFSENTDLSEVLLVATRGHRPGARTVFVNLWRNLDNVFEALAIAKSLEEGEVSDLLLEKGEAHLIPGRKIIGTAYSVSWERVRKSTSWLFYCPYARTFLTRLFLGLLEGRVELPGRRTATIPMTPLRKIGEIGPDVRQVEESFKAVGTMTPYPAFWNHESDKVFTIAQSPNAHLSLKRRKRDDVWSGRGKLLLAERLRLNTQRLVSVLVDRDVLSNSWWEIKTPEESAKILSLWFNSTLGFLVFVGHRLETQGPWVKFKKNTLKKMPVLNPGGISPKQRNILLSAYEELREEPLLPFPRIAEDPTRRRIDEAIEEAFQIPDLSQVREFLAAEPIISLSPLYR
jgi:hypothetical protein